jgi:hypothetical protein
MIRSVLSDEDIHEGLNHYWMGASVKQMTINIQAGTFYLRDNRAREQEGTRMPLITLIMVDA